MLTMEDFKSAAGAVQGPNWTFQMTQVDDEHISFILVPRVSWVAVKEAVRDEVVVPLNMDVSFVKSYMRTEMERAALASIQAILKGIKYLDWKIVAKSNGGGIYLQVQGNGICPDSGKVEQWTSRKWAMSPHMVRSEVIRTAHFAVQGAVLHEMNEHFTYRGERIYNPHMDMHDLSLILSQRDGMQDTRDNGLQGE